MNTESDLQVRKEDQILMSLVHFFVTKENYSPIYVHGVKDEIWLENVKGPYRVIRINSNPINNKEQFEFDQYKIKGILKQVKKKTLSLSVNALNINLNENENEDYLGLKNIDTININNFEDIENKSELLDVFPRLKGNLVRNTNGLDLIFNVTKDINAKTERENKKFEKIFSPKKTNCTFAIMALCTILYLISVFSNSIGNTLLYYGANIRDFVLRGEVYRLITYSFLHAGVFHIACNMYSLYIIGKEIENKYGSWKFLIIYFVSALTGGLLSSAFNVSISVGASGAIFGLLGSLLYFGYSYRLYLKDSLIKQIIPVIILNLVIGFSSSNIDNACHIGGLIGGYLISMLLGLDKDNKKDRINGIILLGIYILFLIYLVFFR